MLQVFSGNGAFDVVADDETRPVGIREDDQAPLFRHPAKQRHLLPVLENAEPRRFQNGGIHHLTEGVFVVAPLYHNGLPDFNHCVPPAPTATAAAPAGAAGSVQVTAPMPGKVVAVKASVGQAVKKGEVVLVLEAMKMENDIVAPEDGTIASINVANGDAVESGAVLATLN